MNSVEETLPPRRLARAWATLSEAIRGSNRDFTEGPIGRAVLLLAIPMVMEMIMESVFAVADIFWVSKLGANAVATVGITESMLALIYAVAIGVSIRTSARAWHRPERSGEPVLRLSSGPRERAVTVERGDLVV